MFRLISSGGSVTLGRKQSAYPTSLAVMKTNICSSAGACAELRSSVILLQVWLLVLAGATALAQTEPDLIRPTTVNLRAADGLAVEPCGDALVATNRGVFVLSRENNTNIALTVYVTISGT